ncbi:hypothetical protein LTR36_010297 [Oleoguttula mirabilis]|uniref:F-box domain-containing protein n=1 Tax=Oleoguttula mirabilis TaxID=1507867 RepID=A0AAV9J4F2_9PEZI|nr:hypothetical protein LTR36_010297 [Oleoguttula mirabilis]
MALDQQRNWTIAMADNLERVKRSARSGGTPQDSDEAVDIMDNHTPAQREHTGPPVYLPDEIIIQILEYTTRLPTSQRTLASCCLLAHQWYDAAVPLLYAQPYLYGKNFDPFVRTMCPSINLHVRKSPLSELVKVLNMASLVHQGRPSMTARLLGRTKGSLEEFVAPQASFLVNCLAGLSKCVKLRTLDLSLVSEAPPLPELFRAVAHLQHLRTFRLPRSGGFGAHHKPTAFTWSPHLENLSLSGGIDGHFLHGVVTFPQTLRSLTIEHCPQAKGYAITHLLKTAVRPLRNLESLKIRFMPRLGSHALDDILLLLPQIQRLSLSVDYITPALFDEGHFNHAHTKYALPSMDADADDPDQLAAVEPLQHNNLRTLELTNSGDPGVEDKISAIDILIAIDEGSLPKLRQVRVAKTLLWQASGTASDAEALADVLIEASKRDWEDGVGVFAGGMQGTGVGKRATRGEQEQGKVWERVAGVWMFDG